MTPEQALAQLIGDAWGMYARMASVAFSNGATLTCKRCGTKRSVNQRQCARYLRRGWPECHGKEMEIGE